MQYCFFSLFSILIAYIFRFFPIFILFPSKTYIFYCDNAGPPYSSRFVQYPHYPIACCLPHLSTTAQNCHGESINLAAKRKTSRQKEKPHGKISSIPRGHFNSYFFCREVMVILFAMKLFFLP